MKLQNYLSVTALTKYIKVKLEGDQHLRVILIKGEISNFKHHSRGHFYFTLKDEQAQVSCIMFSRDTKSVQFHPKEGDHVLIVGQISVYQPSGTYSIQVKQMKLDGIGELYLKYEALKKELTEKGWFDDKHKKPIPPFPKRIGVITSATGAVIEDIKNTVSRRYLLTEIYLYPALVQGSDSSTSVAKQIKRANERQEVDVLIVGRGGGSIEDLWGFNEMPAIEAIYHSDIPVITAIGHETDFTLSDFVSDLRAPTPTAAAELATPNKTDLLEKITVLRHQVMKAMQQWLNEKATQLTYLDQTLEQRSPSAKLDQLKEKLRRLETDIDRSQYQVIDRLRKQVDLLTIRLKSPLDSIRYHKETIQRLHDHLTKNIMYQIANRYATFNILKTELEGHNPLRLMGRGYAVVSMDDHIVSSVDHVHINDLLNIRFNDGIVETVVTGKKEK